MNTKLFFGIFVIALLLFAFQAFADETKEVKEKPKYGLRAVNVASPETVVKAERNLEVKTAKLEAVQERKEAVEEMQKEREALKEKREELKEQIKEAPKEERKELREEAKEELKKDGEKIREERKEKFVEAKARVEAIAKAAKERLEVAKAEQEKVKEEIKSVRNKVEVCKGLETKECTIVREDVKQKTEVFLSSAIERVLGLLQKTRENLAKSKLSEEEKSAKLDEIDFKINEAVELKDKASKLDKSSSADDIKEVNMVLADSWKETQKIIRTSAGTIAAEKLGGVLQITEKLQQRLTTTLGKLKEKGVDVAKVEGKISEFNKLIGEAKSLQTEARQLFLNKEPQKTDELMKEATEKIKESHKKINEAHKILKEILSLLKSEKEGKKALEESTTEEKGEAKTEEVKK